MMDSGHTVHLGSFAVHTKAPRGLTTTESTLKWFPPPFGMILRSTSGTSTVTGVCATARSVT